MTEIMTIILNKISKLERLEISDILKLKYLYSTTSSKSYKTLITLCIEYGWSKTKDEMIFGYDKINTTLLLMKQNEYCKNNL